jgi:microcystin-dependent protein
MTDPFVAEIRVFPFTFAPKGWALCNGQLLPISQNTALFALLGTFYGGDGKSTFALPNLQGSVPVNTGQGPGLSERFLGETGGSSVVTLITTEMPAHNHAVTASAAEAGSRSPSGELFANQSGGVNSYASDGAPVAMAPQAVGTAGGSQPHNNMAPYVAFNFCIALQGVFPPRQ